MKIHSLLLIGLCLVVSAFASAGTTLSQSYTINNIRFIEAGNAVSVELRQGDSPSLDVEADEDVMPRVIVEIEGDRLILGVESEKWNLFDLFRNNNDHATFKVQLPDPAGLKLTGASEARVEELKVAGFKLELSGASHAQLVPSTIAKLDLTLEGASAINIDQLEGEELNASLSGASEASIEAQGKLNKLDITATGASTYSGRELNADHVIVDAAGASTVDVAALKTLRVTATGASNVSYLGSPQVTTAQFRGGQHRFPEQLKQYFFTICAAIRSAGRMLPVQSRFALRP